MKNILYISSFLVVLLIVSIFFVLLSNNHGLEGRYQSDIVENMAFFKKKTKIPDEGYDVLKQMFGNYTITIDGYKCNFTLAAHEVKNYPVNGNIFYNEGFNRDYFCFTISNNEIVKILLIPSNILEIKNLKIAKIEIEDNGFWLIDDSDLALIPKEKFTKQNPIIAGHRNN